MTAAELRAIMDCCGFRGDTGLAGLLGVHRQTVHRWRFDLAPVPGPQAAFLRRLRAWHQRNPPPPPPPGAVPPRPRP